MHCGGRTGTDSGASSRLQCSGGAGTGSRLLVGPSPRTTLESCTGSSDAERLGLRDVKG